MDTQPAYERVCVDRTLGLTNTLTRLDNSDDMTLSCMVNNVIILLIYDSSVNNMFIYCYHI